MSIILRLNKGSELTYTEVDGNFSSMFYSASLIGSQFSLYTYPNVISQSFDFSSLPGFGGIGVQDNSTTIVQAATTLNFLGSGVTVSPNGNTADVTFTGGGDTYTLKAGTKVGASLPLNLDAAAGADSTVNLTEGTGITLTQVSATEIKIDSSGGQTYTNATLMPQNFPGNTPFDNIGTGTSFTAKTFPEMMDLMLYPELFPNLVNPSITSVTLLPSGLRIVGEVITAGNLSIATNFSRGSISPAYGTNGFRSGAPNNYNYPNQAGGSITTPQTPSPAGNTSNTAYSSIDYTVALGAQQWGSSVSYDVGEQPLSSKGNIYQSATPAGTTNTTTRTMTGVYPVFATTVSLGTLTQQPLTTMGGIVQIGTGAGSSTELVTESGGGGLKQTIEVPDSWPVSILNGGQLWNTLASIWDPANDGGGGQTSLFASWNTLSFNKTINGNSVPYTRFTNNSPTPVGPRQFRLRQI